MAINKSSQGGAGQKERIRKEFSNLLEKRLSPKVIENILTMKQQHVKNVDFSDLLIQKIQYNYRSGNVAGANRLKVMLEDMPLSHVAKEKVNEWLAKELDLRLRFPQHGSSTMYDLMRLFQDKVDFAPTLAHAICEGIAKKNDPVVMLFWTLWLEFGENIIERICKALQKEFLQKIDDGQIELAKAIKNFFEMRMKQGDGYFFQGISPAIQNRFAMNLDQKNILQAFAIRDAFEMAFAKDTVKKDIQDAYSQCLSMPVSDESINTAMEIEKSTLGKEDESLSLFFSSAKQNAFLAHIRAGDKGALLIKAKLGTRYNLVKGIKTLPEKVIAEQIDLILDIIPIANREELYDLLAITPSIDKTKLFDKLADAGAIHFIFENKHLFKSLGVFNKSFFDLCGKKNALGLVAPNLSLFTGLDRINAKKLIDNGYAQAVIDNKALFSDRDVHSKELPGLLQKTGQIHLLQKDTSFDRRMPSNVFLSYLESISLEEIDNVDFDALVQDNPVTKAIAMNLIKGKKRFLLAELIDCGAETIGLDDSIAQALMKIEYEQYRLNKKILTGNIDYAWVVKDYIDKFDLSEKVKRLIVEE